MRGYRIGFDRSPRLLFENERERPRLLEPILGLRQQVPGDESSRIDQAVAADCAAGSANLRLFHGSSSVLSDT